MKRSFPMYLKQVLNAQDLGHLNQGLDDLTPEEPFSFRGAIFTRVGRWVFLWDLKGKMFGKSSDQEVLCLFSEFIKERYDGKMPELSEANKEGELDDLL